MTLLVDTSVWSMAFRRDGMADDRRVRQLRDALAGADAVVTTGLVLQELLQGFNGPKSAAAVLSRFQALPLIQPDREDHVAAATIRNTCRRHGLQVGTIDAVLVQLCIRHDLTMLSTDQDFAFARRHVPFRLWSAE